MEHKTMTCIICPMGCQLTIETEEYKTMANFPDEDSIKIIENTVVVKISD